MFKKKSGFLVLLFSFVLLQAVYPQIRTIKGTVKDQQGGPLPGVNVIIVGTQRGTQTDADGTFSIDAAPTDSLQFSFVGMEEQTVLVGNQSVINIVLREKTQKLQQVVVVGYGVQKKESVVGAIGRTDGSDIVRNTGSSSNLADALTGLVPGVITVKTSGLPGGSGSANAPTEVYIRGISTWNGGQPLILVDGVERPMMDIDPNEITSISVLKDASATAVFGVKGANGVILITTKRGQTGKPKLTFDASVSASSFSKMAHVLGSYDANYLKDIAIENGVPADENIWADYVPQQVLEYYKNHTYPDLYPDIDWLDEMTNKVAWSHRYNLNAQGGTDFVKYFVSLGYLNEGDILKTRDYGQGYKPNLGYQRYNFRSNLDFKLSKSTVFTVNLGGYYGKQENIPGYNILRGVYLQPPDLYPVRYKDGVFADYEGFNPYINPVVTINYSGIQHSNRNVVNTDFILKQKLDFITKGLSITGRGSYDTRSYTSGPNIKDAGIMTKYVMPDILFAETQEDSTKYIIYKYPKTFTNETHGYNYVREPVTRSAEKNKTNVYRTLYYSGQLNYARSFGKNAVTGLFLFSRQENTAGSEFSHYREDWVGRVTYNYDERYFLEFNGAYNGSEKFDRKYRFGFFPSLAGGWLVSNEEFFKSALPFINHLKLRYSWGKVGNDEGIARWQYIGGWEQTGQTWYFGSPVLAPSYPIYVESVVPNPNIHWETAEKQNLGVEGGLFSNLISFSFDYFKEHRYDMFIRKEDRLSNVIFGKDLPAANIGELNAHGWEAVLKFSKSTVKQMNFRVNLSLSRAVNKILYREDPELRPDYQKQAGYPINQVRTQINQGIIQSWDEMYTGVMGLDNTKRLPGDFRQVDYNADGIVDQDDNVPYGYTNIPEYNYSGTFSYAYKGFGIVAQLYGVFNVTSNAAYGGVGDAFSKNFSLVSEIHKNDSWAPELGRTTTATYPALRYNTGYTMGNYWMQDFSYLKLQSAQIYYIFKGAGLEHTGISSIKIYLDGNNLYTWSKIPYDFDKQPPLQQFAYALSYPRMRSFILGVNLVF